MKIKKITSSNFFLYQKLKSILDIFLRGFSFTSSPQHSLKALLL
jgi:hypothetical protein